MVFRTILVFWLSCLALPALALDPAGIGQSVVKDWEAWMRKHKIPEGALVVSFEGEIVARGEIRRKITEPAKVASLSKAITAVCALKAVDQAGQKFNTSIAEILPDVLAKHPPKDARFKDITVSHLMNQTSGINSRYHATQIEKLRTFGKENKLWQFSKIAKETLTSKPGSASHQYSNANYLILGLVIEALTEEDYETYCTREILAPIGVTSAKLNDTWRVMSSWGGWEISAVDYATFATHYFAGEHSPGRPGGFFVPAGGVSASTSYGAGIFYRRTGLGYNTWHLGSWRWNGRIKDRFGAYFAVYDNGFTVSTNYAHDAWKSEINRELDALLWRGTHK